jgi:FkbM family methyltransferase
VNLRVAILAGIGRWIGKPRGWERVVRWFAPPEKCGAIGERLVRGEGFSFFAQSVTPLGWQVLFFGTYEPELRAIFRSTIPPGGVVIDVGANVGWHSLLMARLAGPSGRILAVEPNPSVRDRLKANLDANEIENVTVLPFAFSNRDGRVGFYGPPATDGGSGSGHLAISDSPGPEANFDVDARRLDALVDELGLQRLDLLKIDVEGFEWPVLLGAEISIAKFRPQIVFEFNLEYAGRGGGRPEVFAEFFQRHGYTLHEVGRRGPNPLGTTAWPAAFDVWAVPS